MIQSSMEVVHPQWHSMLYDAWDALDPEYVHQLQTTTDWLPGLASLLAAFSMPLTSVRYILVGESPYPRPESAIGYAFWDGAVDTLWSATGLSKAVNRATSLRNLIKMLLYARGDLQTNFSQQAIALLDKSPYVQTASQLFGAFVEQGFLLLNATPVYSEGKVAYHARQWRLFMSRILSPLAIVNPDIRLILLGQVASLLPEARLFQSLVAEHPYNLSFITNPDVVNFFNPLDLLYDHKYNH